MKWLKWLALILVLLLSFTTMTAAQTCPPPAGWQTYTVARGDTLAAIARRYNTTTTTLAQANCISNPNLIHAGTRLYVPPGGSTGTPAPMVIRAAYQPFEKGFMIWNASNGSITVYVGQTGGSVWNFPVWRYAFLPLDPIRLNPPAGLHRPILGFGKVWGHFSQVRDMLGWATAPESAYFMNITSPSTGHTRYSLPNGRAFQVGAAYGWAYVETAQVPTPFPTATTPPPPVPTPAPTQIEVTAFSANPVRVAPGGQSTITWAVKSVNPVEVYLNQLDYQGRMTMSPEFAAPFSASGSQVVTLPADHTGSVRFTLTAKDTVTGTTYTTSPIEIVVEQVTTAAAIRNFTASSNSASPGQEILLIWDASGGTMVLLEIYAQTASGDLFVDYVYNLSQESNMIQMMQPQGTGTRYVLSVVNTPTTPAPYTLEQMTKLVSAEVTVARSEENTLYAAYQPFERGFMLWKSDTEDILVFYNDGTYTTHYIQEYYAFPDNPIPDQPPTGLVTPVSGFGRVWGNVQSVRDRLGWALANETGYNTAWTITQYLNPGSSRFVLPDSRLVTFNGGFWSQD